MLRIKSSPFISLVEILHSAENSSPSEAERHDNAGWFFFDIESIVHHVSRGKTVNRAFYRDLLKDSIETPGQMTKRNPVSLHHDDAPAHSALYIREFSADKKNTCGPAPSIFS